MNISTTLTIFTLATLLIGNPAFSQDAPTERVPPPATSESTLFDDVVHQLETRFVDTEFRERELPAIAERYREAFSNATTLNERREVVNDLLSNVPATHLGLLSKSTYRRLISELMSKPMPTFGFELINLDGKFFAHSVLEGGPADLAGLKRGDRVVLIDNHNIADHSRLDWRSDDSYLIDPPVHYLLCENEDCISLNVERRWGENLELTITASPYCTFQAAKYSAIIIESDGRKIAYIHFWMIHFRGVASLLKEKLESEFSECDALILDLRGRGGNGMALQAIYDVISGKTSSWDRPVVALVNKYSRSAKEVMVYEMKQQNLALVVGERTAGAVIPASFSPVGTETMLMFPTFRMPKYTDAIEGIGVAPDILVQDAGPYSEGEDPLVTAGIKYSKVLIKELENQPDAVTENGSTGSN